MQFDASIVVALIALLGTAIMANANRSKYDREDAVLLEQRLTALETAMQHKVDAVIFTRLEGHIEALKQTLEDRLDPIWDAIMVELPKLLLSPHHQRLDSLILCATTNGAESLSPPERDELATALEIHYINNKKENAVKRLIATLWMHGLRNPLPK